MSINLPTHYVKEYSTNIQLLLQQQGSKLRGTVTEGHHTGDGASPVDQLGSVEAIDVTSRFAPMPRIDVATDRRWVFPLDSHIPQGIDKLDKLRMLTDPDSAYVHNAVMGLGRRIDLHIITAFMGTAKTGVAGGTSTSFTAGNEVDVAVGGSNSKLNVAKLREVKRLMMANHIDFDTEEAFVGITAADHDALLGEIQVVSSDFNGGVPVLSQGKIMSFMGFKFIHCELIETAAAGTNEVNIPVWVKSGMHLGVWDDIRVSIGERLDLTSIPTQIVVTGTFGATRLEENKVYNIESYRA